MKLIFLFFVILFYSVNCSSQGTWTQLANTAPDKSGGLMILLSDGTVLAKNETGGAGGIGQGWNRLTPDAGGSYINGTWTSITPMNFTRLYFSTQLLKDGRLYVCGGEYGTGKSNAEIYNPVSNTWTNLPSPGGVVSDANSEILPDGRVLQAMVNGSLKNNMIYNPITNTFTPGPTCIGIHNESAWVKLADNSILFVDRNSTNSERYIPATNTWTVDAVVPVSLYDVFGLETGSASLLPDGRAWFIGSTGKTAYYNPSGTPSPGTWTVGPTVPSNRGAPDAAAAMMKNGKILCAVSPTPVSGNNFPSPSYFYEFDYLTNGYTLLPAPGGGTSINVPVYVFNMLDLPDGNVLFAEQDTDVYFVYTPNGAQLAAGQPTIGNIIQNGCNSFTITGLLFNGISEGATYGDDWQCNTNYPIIRLTKGPNVYYARSFNWNRTGVQTGLLPDTTQFTLPAGLPIGTYSLQVVANGISSNPVTFIPFATLSSTLLPSAVCSNTVFTYTPTSASPGATFVWTRAAVVGISNAAIIIPQVANPNETLINTTALPKNVIYSYTTTANGCSTAQQVTLVVNPTPTISAIASNSVICSGATVTLTGSGAISYTWSGGVTNGVSFSPTVSTNYTLTGTNAFTCTNWITQSVTVNALPIVTASVSLNPICIGNNVTLNGGGAITYTWTGGVINNVAFSPTATAGYTVNGTDANNCKNTASLNITVNALPTVGATTGNSLICGPPFQGTTTLTGSGANTYTWIPGGTGVSIVVSPSVTSTYTVSGTDVNGCMNSFVITQSVSVCAEISQVSNLNSHFAIYPNPNNGEFTVKLNAVSENMSIEIYNSLGQLVLKEKPNNLITVININTKAKGIYIVRIKENNLVIKTEKIIKE